jgi:hypothetical protein
MPESTIFIRGFSSIGLATSVKPFAGLLPSKRHGNGVVPLSEIDPNNFDGFVSWIYSE